MNRTSALLTMPLVALLVIGCSVEDTISHPDCDGGGSWVIVTQSVPSASLVPCLDPLPRGWRIDAVKIDHDGTVITFGSDRAGTVAARMSFTPSCDVSQAVPSASDHSETDRFEDVVQIVPEFQATRYYVFDGGCVSWEFEFDEGAPSALSIELSNAMQLIDREELQRLLADEFLDEDL